MKKVFTFFAAMTLLASASFAQLDHRLQPGEKPFMAPAAMFKAQLMKTTNTVATPSKDATVISSFPWTENFESGTAPVGFSFIDNDHDGFNWDYAYLFNAGNYGHNGSNGLIGSASYDNDNGVALTPDNWMILPAFQIPSSATDFILSWYEKSQDANYSQEYYSVYINTTGTTVANFTATTAAYSGYSTGDWVKKTVNLGSYAGQTIYIAFRHHNCTDMFYLDIDDIRVGGPELPELTLAGPAAARLNYPVTFYANSSVNTIAWYIDGTLQSTTVDSLTTAFTTVGMHQIVAEATNTVGTVSDTINVDVFSCDNITLPYVPTFIGGLGCWTSRSDSTESGWFASVDMFESDPEGQVLSMSAESIWGLFMSDFPADNWLFSPEINMPATGSYEIAWQVKPFDPAYAGDHYGVYVINGTDTTLLFEESLTGMTDYTQRMAIIPSTVNGDFQIAFRHFNSEGGYVIILDNIQIRPLTAPAVTLAGPAAVENGDAVTFIANAPNADTFAWTIDGNAATATGNTLTHTFTTDGFHTVNVTATNSVGSSMDSLTIEVYTCSAITSFPYTQGFETGIRCWSMVSADPANDDRFGLDTTHLNGNYGFRFSSYNRAEDYNQYLISPELTIPQGDYMVKFMYKGYTSSESFRVLASSTTNDVTDFTQELGTYTTTATEWTEVAFIIPQGSKYIAINYYGNYMYYLYIDDISIEALSIVPTVELEGPETAEVDEDVVFVANAPLATTFSWTVDGVDANTTGNVLTTSFSTAGNHTVQVVATNSIGNSVPVTATIDVYACEAVNTPWTESFEGSLQCWKFITLDETSDGFEILENPQYAHSGNNSLLGNYSDYSDVDQWAISPVINMPADANGYKLSFYTYTTSYNNINSNYEVLVSNGSTVLNDFTTIFSENVGIGAYRQHVLNMSSYAGQSIRIAFHNITAMGGDAMIIDDIELSNTVGINEVAEGGLSLYPNPASSMVSISAEGVEGNVTVQIVDLNGRVMMQQQGNAQSFRFDVSSLAQGAYFVRMTGENVNAVRKLIVK